MGSGHPGSSVELLPLLRGPSGKIAFSFSHPQQKFNCELKDMGFTKLVRVDDGVFENVTRRHGEDKYVDRRRPETFPNLNKTVKD